jgi:hypothetical protein
MTRYLWLNLGMRFLNWKEEVGKPAEARYESQPSQLASRSEQRDEVKGEGVHHEAARRRERP